MPPEFSLSADFYFSPSSTDGSPKSSFLSFYMLSLFTFRILLRTSRDIFSSPTLYNLQANQTHFESKPNHPLLLYSPNHIYLNVQSSKVQIDRATTVFEVLAKRISKHVNRKQVILTVVYQFVRTAAGKVNVAAIKGFQM